MFGRGLQKMVEPWSVKRPRWLDCAQDELGSAGWWLLAAFARIDLQGLVGKATTYAGPDGNASIGDLVAHSVPSNLCVAAGPNSVSFCFGAIGFEKNCSREVVDWRITCSIRDESLDFEVRDARSDDKSLANEHAFVLLKSAIADALQAPPTLTNPLTTSEALSRIDRIESSTEAPWYVPVGMPRTTNLSAAGFARMEQIQGLTLSRRLKEALQAEEEGPLWTPRNNGKVALEARTPLALWTLGTLLVLAHELQKGGKAPSDEFLHAARALTSAERTDITLVESARAAMISSSSRFLPIMVRGRTATAASFAMPMSTWPCRTRIRSVTMGRWKLAKEVLMPSAVGIEAGTKFSYGHSTGSHQLGPMESRKFRQPGWTISGFNTGKDDGFQSTSLAVSAFSVQARSSFIPGSDALLSWIEEIDAMFSAPIGAGEASVLLVDRTA